MNDADRPALRTDTAGSRPVVTKHAECPAARRRLAHELDVLRRAQHPGTVVLHQVMDDGSDLTVRTGFVSGRTLASLGHQPVERLAGIMVSLAATVADLHELGVAHRRLTADHVLIASDGRPVLCGFGDAVIDPDVDARAQDVEALGELLRALVAPLDDVAPIPATRIGRKGTWSGYQRRALLNLADQATLGGARHLTAAQFAENLRRAVPDATLGEPNAGQYESGDSSRETNGSPRRVHAPRRDRMPLLPHRLVIAGGGAFGTLVLLLSVIAIVPSRSEATQPAPNETSLTAPATEPRRDAASPDVPASTDGPSPTTTGSGTTADSTDAAGTPASARLAIGCDSTTGSLGSDSAGHPCPVTVEVVGGVLRIDDDRFDLGLDNLAIAIGDFSCTLTANLAALDLDTGDVFVFDGWAGEQPATAEVLERVPDARRLLAEPRSSDDCHRLVALDAFGIRHELDPVDQGEDHR